MRRKKRKRALVILCETFRVGLGARAVEFLGANFGETEKRRISVSAEIRAEKFLAAEIFFFGSNPKFGRNSAWAKNIYATLT
jgi:hypothetical protein